MKPIPISSAEACGKCFLPIIRNGKQVICNHCGVIGITSASYETTWKPELKTNRHHTRGNPRGRHRGQAD